MTTETTTTATETLRTFGAAVAKFYAKHQQAGGTLTVDEFAEAYFDRLAKLSPETAAKVFASAAVMAVATS